MYEIDVDLIMTNYAVLAGFAVLVVVLLLFIILRNKKDKKEFVDQLNTDYKKPVDKEDDVDEDSKA